MKHLLTIALSIVFLFFSCSTIGETKNNEKKKSEIGQVGELFSYNVRVKDDVMKGKGFHKKKPSEKFGKNIYDVKNSKTITKDIEVLKWILKVKAFSSDVSLYYSTAGSSNYVLLKINTGKENDSLCLTNDPFIIKNEKPEKYYTSKISEVEGKTVVLRKYNEIPWMDETIKTDEATVKKHCFPFNPNSRFMSMNRKTLIERFFLQLGEFGSKMLCERFGILKDNNIYKNKCEVITRKERYDIIFALIDQGFNPFLDTGQIYLSFLQNNRILYSDKNTEHFLFY